MSERPTNKELRAWIDENFTEGQIEAYTLIHPDLGGLDIRAAAKKLGITVQATQQRLARMKAIFPHAFRFEDMCTYEQQCIAKSDKLEREMKKLNYIIGRTKQIANKYNVSFELTEDEFLETIRQPCIVCDREGFQDGITEDGRHFKYNMIMLRNFQEGYHYLNVFPICPCCRKYQGWRASRRFNRLGF